MKHHLALAALLAPIASALVAGTASSQIGLDVSGGIIGESLTLTLSGTVPPGELVVATFSDTTGPLAVGSLLPGEPGFWDQDLSMFSYPSFTQSSSYTNPLGVLNLASLPPALLGVTVFSQAWTVPGPVSFLDLKSNVVTIILGAHNASTPTHLPPVAPHAYANTVRLADGNVLTIGGGAGLGGSGTGSAEIYDYKTSSFAATANFPQPRASAVAVRLNNGKVLVAGGIDAGGQPTASAELYDPATKTFAATGTMTIARTLHAAVKLNDGRVYICGGSSSLSGTDPVTILLSMLNSATATAEIFDPNTGLFTQVATMSGGARTGHVAALLPDGRVLIAGGVQAGLFGIPTFLTSAVRYNSSTNAYVSTASMGGSGRAISSVTTLNDGRVMVAGGLNANIIAQSASSVPDVSIYNNTTNTWQNGPNMPTSRYGHTLVTMPNGDIVAAGGVSGTVTTTTTPLTVDVVERFNGTWSTLTPMLQKRAVHGAALTPDGKRIVLIGGSDDAGAITPGTAELYVP